MVETVSVARPLVGMVTVCEPVAAPKSPCWLTVTLTLSASDCFGTTTIMKRASPPSVTSAPSALMKICGCGSSLSATSTVARPCVTETL